jgi:uncharacterized protein (TIGR02145 family)
MRNFDKELSADWHKFLSQIIFLKGISTFDLKASFVEIFTSRIKKICWKPIVPILLIAAVITLSNGFTGCSSSPQSPPVAAFILSTRYTDTLTILEFDASGSTDREDPSLALSFRWDWDMDGVWDTPYSRAPRNSHRYKSNGVYQPVLQVMDQDGMTDTCSIGVRITDVRKDSSIVDPRDGRSYRVALIEDVWWMSENLDFGTLIQSTQYPSDNSIPEKYFYSDSDSIGKIRGGLYTWNEAMDYQADPGSSGICPPGWRIPEGKYVAALWDLVSFPYPDHKTYLGKGGYLGIDLERSGTFDMYSNRKYDPFIGGFWISELKKAGTRSVPFYFAFSNVFYINNPDTNPQGEYTALSIRCIQPAKHTH